MRRRPGALSRTSSPCRSPALVPLGCRHAAVACIVTSAVCRAPAPHSLRPLTVRLPSALVPRLSELARFPAASPSAADLAGSLASRVRVRVRGRVCAPACVCLRACVCMCARPCACVRERARTGGRGCACAFGRRRRRIPPTGNSLARTLLDGGGMCAYGFLRGFETAGANWCSLRLCCATATVRAG